MNSTENRSRRRSRWPFLILLLPPILGAVCCWTAGQPSDASRVLEAAQDVQSGLNGMLVGIEASEVEALVVERKGESVEIGLLLTDFETSRSDDGTSFFQGDLINLGDYALEKAEVTLRLVDEQGRPVESIDMQPVEEILEPGERVHLTSEFRASDHSPRIVEETVSIGPDDFVYFTTNSYDHLRLKPGILSQFSQIIPFVRYEAVRTNPDHDWQTYQVRFNFYKILRND